MNRKQLAKETSLTSLLSRFGFSPSKKGSSKYWYNSPLANESVPSFVVNLKTNTWRDFGRGVGGDTISFVMEYEHCDFKDALDLILDGQVTQRHNPESVPDVEHGIGIVDVRELTSPHLFAYAESRGIASEVLAEQCKEVDFVFKDWDHITHHAIGFENSKGGWELRNPHKKVGNSPKTWSLVRGTNDDDDSCDVFEGFFDFLSHLTLHNQERPKTDSYILNSLSFCEWVKPSLDVYSSVALYFDHDDAANRHIAEHFDDGRYIDARQVYEGYSDYNEYVSAIIR